MEGTGRDWERLQEWEGWRWEGGGSTAIVCKGKKESAGSGADMTDTPSTELPSRLQARLPWFAVGFQRALPPLPAPFPEAVCCRFGQFPTTDCVREREGSAVRHALLLLASQMTAKRTNVASSNRRPSCPFVWPSAFLSCLPTWSAWPERRPVQ